MNDNKLISIDDDALENVAGGCVLLSCLIAKPVAIVTTLLSSLFSCAPAKSACAPRYDSCAPKRSHGC